MPAPLVDARVRVGVQQELVTAHDAGALGVGESLFLGAGAGRAEGVVVPHEQGRHRHRTALPGPHRVGVLGGDHAEPAAHPDQVQVAGLPAQAHLVAAVCPQLVVAGCPDHTREPVGEQAERPLDVGDPFGHVAGHDQPVVGVGRVQALHDAAVLAVRHVEVADGPQAAPGGRRLPRWRRQGRRPECRGASGARRSRTTRIRSA